MQHKGAAELAHDWTQQAESAATHILIPAAITAACSGLVTYARRFLARHRERAAVASRVADLQKMMMAPDDPDKDDLRTIIEKTRAEQMAQKILLSQLTVRFDTNLQTQADHHAELKLLIQTLRPEQ